MLPVRVPIQQFYTLPQGSLRPNRSAFPTVIHNPESPYPMAFGASDGSLILGVTGGLSIVAFDRLGILPINSFGTSAVCCATVTL
jgi:hypothetical protein